MKNIILGFIPILACICFYLLKTKQNGFKKIILIIYTLLLIIAFYRFLHIIVFSINNPQVWDFTAFYLYGKTAAGGYNFYQPENLHIVFNSLDLKFSEFYGFNEEIVDVGFTYPPPTILYFAPLGFLFYKTALISWTIVNLFFAFGCIYLIYNLFFKVHKLNGLILVSILFFTFLPVLSTILYAQTNFILLFYLLLMKKYSYNKIAGVFFALAIFTKPFMIIFSLFFIFKKKWAAILYSIISSAIIIGITAILFGKAPFVSYIYDNPINRLPKLVYYEDINQSLHAVLLRFNLITLDRPLMYIVIFTAIFLITAAYSFFLLKRKLYDYIWVVLLLVILIIYPGTLSYYGVLLLFIVFQFFDANSQLYVTPYLSIAIFGIVYYLTSVSLFTAICFLLIVIIFKSMETFIPIKLYIKKPGNSI